MELDLIATSDALVPELIPMPPDAPEVCPLCRSGRTDPLGLCSSCEVTSSQVTSACDAVIPITFYTTPSPLRERMHDYKEHPDIAVREAESKNLAAIAARYLYEHGEQLESCFGPWDATVAVPSTHHGGPPALQTAVETYYPEFFAPFERPLDLGAGEMEFRRAREDGFRVRAGVSVEGRRFLLLDDTFTTGARIQSAYHALIAAGADVPAVIVVARKISSDERYGGNKVLARQKRISFDFEANPWWVS